MTNREISAVFRDIGSLLQIRGEDDFRARIYERAANIIEEFPDELVSKDPQQNTSGYNREAVEKLRATRGIGKPSKTRPLKCWKPDAANSMTNSLQKREQRSLNCSISGGRCKNCWQILSGTRHQKSRRFTSID